MTKLFIIAIISMNKSPLSRSVGKAIFIALCCVWASSAYSSLVVWQLNPNGLDAAVGSPSQTFTSSGYTIAATGYDHPASGPDTLHQLFFKNGGADELGLGLVGTVNNELQVGPNGPANYIQLNITGILSQGFLNGKIEVGSVQTGESFNIYGSNSAGTLGTLLASNLGSSSDNQFVAIPNFGLYGFISIGANSADVLPVAFEAMAPAPVPEMSTLFPIVGLLAAVLSTHVLRRRHASQSAEV